MSSSATASRSAWANRGRFLPLGKYWRSRRSTERYVSAVRTCDGRALLAWATVLLAACSGGGTASSPTATGRGNLPGTASSPTATGRGNLPRSTSPATQVGGQGSGAVGIRFAGAPLELPGDVTNVIADGDGLLAVGMLTNSGIDICPRGSEGCGRVAANPVVYARAATGKLTQTQIDHVSTYRMPDGFGLPQGFRPRALARGRAGIVVTGTIVGWDQNVWHHTTVRGVLWHSSDGDSWQRIDLRQVVGDSVLAVGDVKATEAGFVVIGEIGGRDMADGRSHGIVLTSADGVTWVKSAELTLPAAVELRELLIQPHHWLIHGVEYVCSLDAYAMPSEASDGLTHDRLWSSDDDGLTWDLVDLAATGVAGDEPPLPTTTQCTVAPSVSHEPPSHSWSFGMVAASQGTFAVGSSDGARVAVTTDLHSWKVADLPDGTPSNAGGATASTPQRILTTDDSGLDIISYEAQLGADGVPKGSRAEILQWHSGDNGTTWVLLPTTEPLALEGALVIEANSAGTILAVDTVADPRVNRTEHDGLAAILPVSLKSLIYIGRPAA